MPPLVPLTPEDATRRLEASTAWYVDELTRAGLAREEAAAQAIATLGRLLPDGVATPGHRFAGIDRDGTTVGYAWFGPHPSSPGAAYVYDLEIDPPHRGRGLGGAALREIARIAAGDGAARLGLQVFESNAGAVRLYERLGFVTTRAGEGRREMWLALPDPIGIDDLQRVMAGAWPAPETAALGEWLLRAGRGFTRRANSAVAAGDPGMPAVAALDAVEGWYAARGLPPVLTLAGPVDADLTGAPVAVAATARGYRVGDATLTLTAPADDPAGGPVTTHDAAISVGPALEDDWLAAYGSSREIDPPVARAILTGSAEQAFATARAGGRVVAIGRLAINDGWGGITAMWTDPRARRRGLGRAVLAALREEAVRHGITRLNLQTESGNAPALALYTAAGFAPHHRYVYLAR